MYYSVEQFMNDLTNGIREGKMDIYLARISEAITLRKATLKYVLQAGDRVKLIKTSPQYLNGSTGTIIRWLDGDYVTVDLDRRIGKYFKGVNCHVNIIERI